ncbi:conserved phage C-terminal domain-containing protein [Eubacteriaceae bacterium ES2]|nr:conserved phage C-terminal domain-containing protein [Eubacteriaceae bacterium ES2]
MNYILEINAFERWLETNHLSATSQLLWYKLVALCNRCGWAEWIGVDNQRLMFLIQCKSEKTFIRARDSLINNGLFEYRRGKKWHPGRYKMISMEKFNTVKNTVNSTVNSTVNPTVETTDINKPKVNKTFKKETKKNKKLNDQTEQSMQFVQTEELEQLEKTAQTGKSEKLEQSDQSDFSEQSAQADQLEQSEKSEQSDQLLVSQVIDYLNESCQTAYKPTTATTRKHIKARQSEGFALDDFKAVIDTKKAEWLNDPVMYPYLRPQTLFGTKFEGYLNQKKRAVDQVAIEANGYDYSGKGDRSL